MNDDQIVQKALKQGYSIKIEANVETVYQFSADTFNGLDDYQSYNQISVNKNQVINALTYIVQNPSKTFADDGLIIVGKPALINFLKEILTN